MSFLVNDQVNNTNQLRHIVAAKHCTLIVVHTFCNDIHMHHAIPVKSHCKAITASDTAFGSFSGFCPQSMTSNSKKRR